MSDDDGLPRMRTPSPTRLAVNKKRARGTSYASSNNSSDGMFFSSDDLAEASRENYDSPRRKKHIKKTWWEPEDRGQKYSYTQYRQEERKLPKDSGVFMASDVSGSEDGFMLEPTSSPPQIRKTVATASSAFNNTFLSKPVDPSDKLVRDVIRRSVENGDEKIDLSQAGLESIPNRVLEELNSVVRQPRFELTDESAYKPLVPEIELFLSGNKFRTLPGAICALKNLSFLTVRSNKLTELPHAVGALCNLKSLNVAANKLRWLPYELLGLISEGKLEPEKLNVRPNPLVQPWEPGRPAASMTSPRFRTIDELKAAIADLKDTMEVVRSEDPEEDRDEKFGQDGLCKWNFTVKVMESLLSLWSSVMPGESISAEMRSGQVSQRFPSARLPKQKPTYLASSAVAFFDLGGSPRDKSVVAPSRTHYDQVVIPIATAGPVQIPAGSSRVPSFLELCMQQCAAAENILPCVADPEYGVPAHLQEFCESAVKILESGGRSCSTCGRKYTVARAEWIEYWHIPADGPHVATDELATPFIRRVCSWACATPTESA